MSRFSRPRDSQSGAALILILGIVALLTVMVVAFLGTSSKQITDAKSATTAVEKNQLSEFATSQFLSDLKNEILAGSIFPASGDSPVLYPASPLSAVPDRFSTSRSSDGDAKPSAPVMAPPNLLKQSAFGRSFFDVNLGQQRVSGLEDQLAFPKSSTYPPSNRASKISSDSSVSAARWNRPLLLPREKSSSGNVFPDGYVPKTSGAVDMRISGLQVTANWTWQPPDWIYVAQDGSNPISFDAKLVTGSANPVVGRYAYQAYDIGGLLDLNVAGYDPSNVPKRDAGKRGSTGLADLTQIGLNTDQIKALIKFRNPTMLSNTSGGGPYGNNYINYLLRTPDPKSTFGGWPANNGFMRVGSFGDISNNAFTSRSQLMKFLLNGMGTAIAPPSDSGETAALMDVLQYLTHFSRSLEQPSYRPGFYLSDSGGTRTLSNASFSAGAEKGPSSSPESPVFIRPSIVPPSNNVDDIIYPIDVVAGASPRPPDYFDGKSKVGSGDKLLHATLKQPYEMALGNNRGGNDAWGTLRQRSYGENPISTPTSNIAPSQVPPTTALQDVINPAFLEVRVISPFTRMDNTTAVVGEPLVKKRFPLERLSWITYKGPSAELSNSDPLYNAFGTAENIRKAFGLRWTKSAQNDPENTYFWVYDHGKPGDVFTLPEVASSQGREPDFVELLYASIAVGSVGKSALASHTPGQPWDPATYQQVRDRTSRFQILEIVANLIDQYDTDSYPTVIKLPNGTSTYPALFTARGVEDLPYFYRLHWRGLKNDMPGFDELTANPDLGDGGILDITSTIGTNQYASGVFKCGATSLVLFPELWNPHAQKQGMSSSGVDSGPTQFRVIAASTTPNDILLAQSPVNGAPSGNDQGLQNNPKLFDGPNSLTAPLSQQMWWHPVVQKNFGARVTGDFYFSYDSLDSSSGWDLQPWLSMPSIPGQEVTFNNDTTMVSSSKGYRNLFWNYASTVNNTQPPPAASLSITQANTTSAYLYPIFDINFSSSSAMTIDDAFHTMITTEASVQKTTPLVGGSLRANFGGAIATGAPSALTLHPANWYVLSNAASKFPAHFNANNPIRIALSHASVAKADKSTMVERHSVKDPLSNSWMDFRGTELLFADAAGTALFREPTPLAFVDNPKGMTPGASFFSTYPYTSGLKSGKLNWVGFSLGEAPSQYIVACRLETGIESVVATGEKYPNGFLKFDKKPILPDGTPAGDADFLSKCMMPVNMATNQRTSPWPSTAPAPTASYFRFFLVPVNMISLADDHYLTIQVQFKDKDKNWVTYDERYIRIKASKTPVLFKSQLTPQVTASGVSWPTAKRMGWGDPLISSYDPRSSRFGHPGRDANTRQSSVQGTQRERCILSPMSPLDTGFNLVGDGMGPNKTDRYSLNMIDSDSTDPKLLPTLLTADTNVPTAWNMIDQYTWAFPYLDYYPGSSFFIFPFASDKLFSALLKEPNPSSLINDGNRAPDLESSTVNPSWGSPGRARWWAQGEKPSGKNLWQKPSVNANDYGWFSRHPKPISKGPLDLISTDGKMLNGGELPGVSISNFRRKGYFHNMDLSQWRVDEAEALHLGAFTENLPPKYANETSDPLYKTTDPEYRQAYADPDDVIRRAMGAFAAYGGYSGSLDGLPQGQGSGTNKDNRPIVLNRAFQSVADMGYAFRGSPWKNLSFSTPETGDAALLDVFCIAEPPPLLKSGVAQSAETPADPLVAGKVNLNTRQEKVLQALLNGALKDEISTADTGLNAESLVSAQTLIGRTSSTKVWLGPLRNVSELAGRLFGKDLSADTFNTTTDPVYTSTVYRTVTEPNRNPDLSKQSTSLNWHFTGFSADLDSVFKGVPRDQKNQRMREAVIRALADGGQTRVWNIMLDLVVQTGRLVKGATDLNKFTRESERRVWVFLAIDRLTGKILDQQVEDIPD